MAANVVLLLTEQAVGSQMVRRLEVAYARQACMHDGRSGSRSHISDYGPSSLPQVGRGISTHCECCRYITVVDQLEHWLTTTFQRWNGQRSASRPAGPKPVDCTRSRKLVRVCAREVVSCMLNPQSPLAAAAIFVTGILVSA